MNSNEPVRPQTKACEKNVEVPTILVEPLWEGGEPEVFVQWFGESSAGMSLGEMQFRFPVPASVGSYQWMGHPELCKVIILGQIKDWPKSEAAQNVADTVAHGDLDAWILFVVAPHYTMKYPSGDVGPCCFMISMNILLADGVCGVINPRPYCDMSVLDRENEKVRQQQANMPWQDMPLLEEFAEQLDDDP